MILKCISYALVCIGTYTILQPFIHVDISYLHTFFSNIFQIVIGTVILNIGMEL